MQMRGTYRRPYIFVHLRQKHITHLKSPKVPVLIDPGADKCYFNDQLAYTFGVNPADGRVTRKVAYMHKDDEAPTAVFPITAEFPQLGLEIDIPDAEFTRLRKGWNGLLGHHGFLNLFESVTFIPQQRVDLVLPRPPTEDGIIRQTVYR